MDINIYSKYKVYFVNKYCYHDIEIDDFKDGLEQFSKIYEGSELIELIVKLIQHRDFTHICEKEKVIYTTHFDPHSGECAEIEIKYEEVSNEI